MTTGPVAFTGHEFGGKDIEMFPKSKCEPFNLLGRFEITTAASCCKGTANSYDVTSCKFRPGMYAVEFDSGELLLTAAVSNKRLPTGPGDGGEEENLQPASWHCKDAANCNWRGACASTAWRRRRRSCPQEWPSGTSSCFHVVHRLATYLKCVNIVHQHASYDECRAKPKHVIPS